MKLEKMKLPVFGEEDGVYCPHFGLVPVWEEDQAKFVSRVEFLAATVLGDLSMKEYLVRRAEGGNMPRLNCNFEEMGFKYEDRPVPSKILMSIETKASKASAAKKSTIIVESKNRKTRSLARATAKKVKLMKASHMFATASMGVGAQMMLDIPNAGRAGSEIAVLETSSTGGC